MANIIVVHGFPGSGKTTQSKRLLKLSTENCPIYHISAGERLRAIRTGEFQSRYGDQVNKPDAPKMLDHNLVNAIMFEYVSSCPPESVVLVDGFPRFKDAVEPFISAIQEGDHNFLGSLHLEISLETSRSRLEGRGIRRGERFLEITEDVVEKRFWEHTIYTQEAVAALAELAPVVNVDANSREEEVWESFSEAIGELVNSR